MSELATLYGGVTSRRVQPRDLTGAKQRGERWPMLTSYDCLTARIFDDAGIPVLLVGDSVGNNVLGYSSTVPVTVEEMIVFTSAVVRATSRAMVVGDLPYGSYQQGPAQALATTARFVKEAGAQGVKLEGGRRCAAQIAAIVDSGVPVMGHVGLTPQSELTLGLRVQGRSHDDAELVLNDALAVQDAGAFAVVLEAVPAELAKRITAELSIPTVGIGAGVDCDAQVLVWTDMAGLTPQGPSFVKRYAELGATLSQAAGQYAAEVRAGSFPDAERSYR
jgi:3-methyl-2-oxobutanoate hydroxymethyltransferase